MKKCFRILSLLICLASFFSLFGCIGPGVSDYNEVLFGDYTFWSTGGKQYAITDGITDISGYIYKYTYDKTETYIAAHLLQIVEADTGAERDDVIYERTDHGITYSVIYDKMIIFCAQDRTTTEFDTNAEFLEYCESNGIELHNWRYPSAGGHLESEVTELTDGYTIHNMRVNTSAISLDGKEIIYGIITDIETSSTQITFRLRRENYGYDAEYPDEVNVGLSPLSDEPVGKYRRGFLDYTDVYYDKDITIDINTGEITEKDH